MKKKKWKKKGVKISKVGWGMYRPDGFLRLSWLGLEIMRISWWPSPRGLRWDCWRGSRLVWLEGVEGWSSWMWLSLRTLGPRWAKAEGGLLKVMRELKELKDWRWWSSKEVDRLSWSWWVWLKSRSDRLEAFEEWLVWSWEWSWWIWVWLNSWVNRDEFDWESEVEGLELDEKAEKSFEFLLSRDLKEVEVGEEGNEGRLWWWTTMLRMRFEK